MLKEAVSSKNILTDVPGTFYPAIVQMDATDPKKFRKRKEDVVGE